MCFLCYLCAELTGAANCETTVPESAEKAVGAGSGAVHRQLGVCELDGGFRADPSGTANPHRPLFGHGETGNKTRDRYIYVPQSVIRLESACPDNTLIF